MASFSHALRVADETVSSVFDRAFAPAHNPWRHLGALAFLCLMTAVTSGIVAYALYDTSVSGAYGSGLRLQNDPLLFGRLLRGLHRYSADAFMFLSLLHLAREGARGHFRGVRWFSWLTGIPLLWMLWISGVTGLWLLWDARSIFSVTATAEWLQALPVASELLARNFLTAEALNDRFFSLIMFIHIGMSLLLLAGVWVHVQRVSQPRMWPPRVLAAGCLAVLTLLALKWPVTSLGPADTGNVPAQISLDWFYHFVHPLVDTFSAASVWWMAAALTLVLGAMPMMRLPRKTVRAAAQVDLANCNGCSRCVADCPFVAVTMIARTDLSRHPSQASVNADLCASCGICVGSCPSSTPFRHTADIVSGIEMPDEPIARMRQTLQQKLTDLAGQEKVILFSCRQATDLHLLADASTAVMDLECSGMLPPSFLEYAARSGATGMVIAGCREGDCEYRLGDQWVRERLLEVREPRLRASAPRDRIKVVWAGRDVVQVRNAILILRNHLSTAARSNGEITLEQQQYE